MSFLDKLKEREFQVVIVWFLGVILSMAGVTATQSELVTLANNVAIFAGAIVSTVAFIRSRTEVKTKLEDTYHQELWLERDIAREERDRHVHREAKPTV